MRGMRKEIEGLDGFELVAVLGEDFEVSGQCGGVAGDVDDFSGFECD